MPIEFAPPSPNLQGFQIPAAQYTDPLQTLAQIGQLRTQNLQQQSAGLNLEQERLKLDSNKALLASMVKAGTQGTPDEIFQRIVGHATQSGQVLPGDLITMQEHYTKMRQDAANQKKADLENQATQIDRLRGLYEPLQRPGATDEDFARANATADALGIDKSIPRLTEWADPAHVEAFSNQLALHSTLLNEAKERAATEASRATAAKEKVLQTEGEQKVAAGKLHQVSQEIQSFLNPETGVVDSPKDWAGIQARHPDVQMPLNTRQGIARFIRSQVPEEKQPEFDLKTKQAEMGLMGNTEFDQFLAKNAQALGPGRTPANLNAQEFNKILQDYAKYKQDPTLLALAIGQKGLQEALLRGQVAAQPTEQDAADMAADLRAKRISPSQAKANLQSRGMNAMTMVERAMRKLDPEFNWEQAESDYNLAHSPGFQQTVRYIGYVGQVIPRIIDAADRLNNGKIRSINAVKNWAANQLNGVDIAKFNTDRIELGDAVAKVLQGGGTGSGTSDKKLEQGMSLIKETDSPQVIRAVAGEISALIKERRGALTKGTFLENVPTEGATQSGGGQAGPYKILVKTGSGQTHGFYTEEVAKKFADLMKQKGGTTTRIKLQ